MTIRDLEGLMKHSSITVVLAILVSALPALGVGGTSPALAQVDGRPAAHSTPILEALSMFPADIDAFKFTDWAALKAVHGGVDVTSASPLTERQQLMLDITRDEAPTFPLGLHRLATWSERWGWDTSDLEWQASCCYASDFTIPRFREDWDAGPFMARLDAEGYERRDRPHATSFTLEQGAEAPDALRHLWLSDKPQTRRLHPRRDR